LSYCLGICRFSHLPCRPFSVQVAGPPWTSRIRAQEGEGEFPERGWDGCGASTRRRICSAATERQASIPSCCCRVDRAHFPQRLELRYRRDTTMSGTEVVAEAGEAPPHLEQESPCLSDASIVGTCFRREPGSNVLASELTNQRCAGGSLDAGVLMILGSEAAGEVGTVGRSPIGDSEGRLEWPRS